MKLIMYTCNGCGKAMKGDEIHAVKNPFTTAHEWIGILSNHHALFLEHAEIHACSKECIQKVQEKEEGK